MSKKSELKKGLQIEREHYQSLKPFLKPGVKFEQVSKAIAKDHVKEDKKYYSKLKKAGLKDEGQTMAKIKPLPPYDHRQKPTFKLQNVPGIYIIFKAGKIIYVGYSRSNLYKTMYRHFQAWNDKTGQYRTVITDLSQVKVGVIYTKSGRLAKLLESAYILKHKPEMNANVYNGFIMDDKEKAALKQAEQLPQGQDIIEFKGDLPF